MKDDESRSADAASVEAEVRAFYEHHPPPIDSLEKYRRIGQDGQKRRVDYYLFWPVRPYREDQSILVAGCGTSQAAKHSLRWRTGGGKSPPALLHDDAKREYAYGPARGLPNTKVGAFTQALYDEAKKKGWTVISMKNDWKAIFSFDK